MGFTTTILTNQYGCDSIVFLETQLLLSQSQVIQVSGCPGDTLYFANQIITSDSIVFDTLSGMASNGCDSIIQYEISYLPYPEVEVEKYICEGDTLLFGNRFITSTGQYRDTTISLSGCDTIIILELTVYESDFTNLMPAVLCAGEFFVFNNEVITESGVYTDTLSNQYGCDSILQLELEFIQPVTVEWKDTFCIGDEVSLFGMLFSVNNPTAEVVIPNQEGCDSVLMNIVLYFEQPAPNLRVESVNCLSDSSGQLIIEEMTQGLFPMRVEFMGVADTISEANLPFTYTALEAGAYQLLLEDFRGCTSIIPFSIPEPEQPHLSFSSSEIVIDLGETIELKPFIPFSPATVIWSSNHSLLCDTCLPLHVSPTENSQYIITALDSNFCEAIDSILVRVIPNSDLFIPNIFSPNGDGYNDYFTVYAPFHTIKEISDFRIYDRWGQMIYHQQGGLPNTQTLSWDGKFRGEVANPGIYIYLIQVHFMNGQKHTFTGSITLTK